MNHAETQSVSNAPASPPVIVARAGSYYRNTRFILAAVCVVMGLWFGYDGFIAWPESNRKIEAIQERLKAAEAANDQSQAGQLRSELKEYKWRTNADLLLQRGLFAVLPVAGIALLAWTLYRSRGEYRLEGDMLSVPGHPAVRLDQITELNSDLWDRKGIAVLNYDAGGSSGQIILDDFVYERKPTDAIYDRVRASLGGGEPPATDTGTNPAAGDDRA